MAQFEMSVLVTTYKALEYLQLCVESILRNGVAATQIVIYADGSGQPTLDYLRTLDGNSQVKYRYEAENVGITRATNRAAEMADGRYLYFVNDDMVFAPGFDAALLRHAAPGRVLTGGMIETERENMRVAAAHIVHDFGLKRADFDLDKFNAEVGALAEDRLEEGIGYPFLIEKEFFYSIGAIDERFSGPVHDPDLFYRVALAGAEMMRVRDSLCYHFSGRSLRFEGEKPTVSASWITSETEGKIAFLKKWGERPQYRFGGIPRPGVSAPDQRLSLKKRLHLAIIAFFYRRKAKRRLKKLAKN